MRDIAWLGLTAEDVLAGDEWLSAAERAVQARLVVPKRRDDWRLGRFAAKRALGAWLASGRGGPSGAGDDEGGGDLPPRTPLTLTRVAPADLARLEVLAAADGAPEAWCEGRRLAVTLSLSHSHGRALVALAALDRAVGCDIERIEPRGAAFVDDYFTADERAFLRTRPAGEQPLWVTLVWSAKESALKALRLGLRLPTQAVEVRLRVSESAGPLGAPHTWHGAELTARLDDEGGGCVALAAAWRWDAEQVWALACCLPRSRPPSVACFRP